MLIGLNHQSIQKVYGFVPSNGLISTPKITKPLKLPLNLKKSRLWKGTSSFKPPFFGFHIIFPTEYPWKKLEREWDINLIIHCGLFWGVYWVYSETTGVWSTLARHFTCISPPPRSSDTSGSKHKSRTSRWATQSPNETKKHGDWR